MSLADSDSHNTESETAVVGTEMGDVMGKEADEVGEMEEMSSEIAEIGSEREDADGAPSSEEHAALSLENQLYSCGESESDDEGETDSQGPCTCDACKDRRVMAESTMEEMKRLQAHWMDLRQYIRMVYRMAIEAKAPADSYRQYIKEHVQKLCQCDPHQLYQRLESQVQEFVIETKVRQLEMLKRECESPDLPFLFISGLLDSYKRLMTAASELTPLLEKLESDHLSKFNLTWKLMNQHLYQSCVYTDPFIQNTLPEYIAKLSNCNTDPGDENKKLVRDFLSFDDEITLVGSLWREAESRIHEYNQEQATIKAKQRMLKEDWEFFKAQRKLIHQKIWNKTNSELRPVEEVSCPCDECAMSQLLNCGGLVTPPQSPAPPEDCEVNGRVDGEGREQTEQTVECECHVCTAPPAAAVAKTPPMDLESGSAMNLNLHGGGFHLYPHIHGTGGGTGGGTKDNVANVYPHLYNIHSSLLANGKHPESAEHGQDKTVSPVLRPSTPPVPPPKRPEPPPPVHSHSHSHPHPHPHPHPPPAKGVKPHRHSTTQTPAPPRSSHQSLPDVVPPACHGRKPCHGHDHDDETSPEDSCSDRSSSTQRGDSRHCDCCYCEVFGHGVPSVAPVSRNYTEMRERLRQLLTKKKAKCKSGMAPSPTNVPATPHTTVPSGNNMAVNGEVTKVKDPRDLEDLLDFIEGNPSQKCKDEKKAAKKARQKQKKQEEIEKKKREEEEAERRRIEEEEAARALLKQQRKEAKKAKKKKKALASLETQEAEETPPQMVTIKRVMEPNRAEPTVTITLRGPTPRDDKVLYTLLNGQVCPQSKKGKQGQQNNQTGGGSGKAKPQNNNQSTVNTTNGSNKIKSKTKKEFQNNQKVNNPPPKQKKEPPTKAAPAVSVAPAAAPAHFHAPAAQPPPAAAPKLTSPTAIQINNAINRLSSRPPAQNNFTFDSLKLPPGITITKVDPSQVAPPRRLQQQQHQAPPKPSPPPPAMPVAPAHPVPPSNNVIVVDTNRLKDLTSIANKDATDDTNGKKKKNKKKNGNITNNVIPANELPKSNNMVRLTMNGGPPKRIGTPPQMPMGNAVPPPQAAIIKVNGSMVTIRSPALQQALNAQQQTDPTDANKKKKKKKKGGSQQDESWSIDEDSVFAPKDIDLENGEMDETERELEAFKRFCLQSVPPKRKEKVHLNIKDIVLKKKSSAISCS